MIIILRRLPASIRIKIWWKGPLAAVYPNPFISLDGSFAVDFQPHVLTLHRATHLNTTTFGLRYGIMCGIHVVISSSEPGEIPANLHRCLCNRGPDHILTRQTRLDDAQGDAQATNLAFTSTVLALRGDHIAQQPFVDSASGSVFCWNGEAWKIRHHDVAGNDGEVVAGLLNEAITQSSAEREDAILKVLRSIDGPFAFVFFDKPSKKLYFGRDRLGRRSLLIRQDDQELVLSSVADSIDSQWKEVEADGVYVVELASREQQVDGTNEFGRVATRLQWLEGEDAEHFVSPIAAGVQCLCLSRQYCPTHPSRSLLSECSTTQCQLKERHHH